MSTTDRNRKHTQGGRRVRMRVSRVKSPGGRCPNGHREGDEWVVAGHTPRGICIGAFGACLPYLTTLRWGGSFPWERKAGTVTVSCPDCEHQVIWRLEAVPGPEPSGDS